MSYKFHCTYVLLFHNSPTLSCDHYQLLVTYHITELHYIPAGIIVGHVDERAVKEGDSSSSQWHIAHHQRGK